MFILNNLFFGVIFSPLLFNAAAFPQVKGKAGKTTANSFPVYKLNTNRVSTFVYANGETDVSPNDNAGFEYPKRSNKHCVYQSGFLWGAKVNGQVRVGGTTYTSGLLPGSILPDGTAEDTSGTSSKIWRVRPDWETGSVSSEIADGEGTEQQIRALYKKDWEEWPAAKGAPYKDVNNNGSWDPSVDIPGVPGASQTIWFVTNDLNPDVTQNLYGSLPMGIECQVTVWAYTSTAPLSNVIFRKYKIINKSNTSFNDMYAALFVDPDVGDATDDFAGVDTLLSLGYAYNALSSDMEYQDNPPAVGFDFIQGPIVSGTISDTAITGGIKIPGKKNLGASSFYYFIGGSEEYGDPDLGEYEEGTLYIYNLFQGIFPNGKPFPVPPQAGGGTTKFLLSGDPVAGTGYLDGIMFSPGDRRFGMASGPFNMAAGDTQEVVVAEIAAGASPGIDNIQAVAQLKVYDSYIQSYFHNSMLMPELPAPSAEVTNLDTEIVLRWDVDTSSVKSIENYNSGGHKFQGYNVYQLPRNSSSISEGVKIATFDIVDNVEVITGTEIDPATSTEITRVQQAGTNSGLKHYLDIKKDYINNSPLINGTRYYFAVTAYTYNNDPNAPQTNLESRIIPLTAVPQGPLPGIRFSAAHGDTLSYTRISGLSDGFITPIVVDPSKTTGHTYTVTFQDSVWTLTDSTTGKVKLSMQYNQSGNDEYFIIDGIMTKVFGPPLRINYLTFSPAIDRWFTGVNAGLETLGGGMGLGKYFFGSSVTGERYVTVEIRFVSDRQNGQRAYRYLRGGSPNYGYQDYEKQYFTVWDIDSKPPKQLSAGYVEQNGNEAANKTWQPTFSTADREYLFIYDTPYTDTPQQSLMDIRGNSPDLPTLYAMWPMLRQGYEFKPRDGQVLTVIPNHVNTSNDVFSFKAPAVTDDQQLEKQDVQQISVYPNPYYSFKIDNERFVTFNHMPSRAVVRIFNLAGQLVRRMEKDDNTQFFTWDLKNDHGVFVASGLFVVYIDMPELGSTKILKLSVIRE